MAQFDENKVINALHPEKAEVGKKYWFSDSITLLKRKVENNHIKCVFTLKGIDIKDDRIFSDSINTWELIYPYEEPPKQRMTNIQLAEWCAKGNGMFKFRSSNSYCYIHNSYSESELNEEVHKDVVIRSWDSEEWIEPTVDIYERDCKKEN